MAGLFLMPRKILYGSNALQQSGQYIKELGGKALIVTDRVMASAGNVAKLTGILAEMRLEYEIYAGINSEPTVDMVEQGVAVYRQAHCDLLIALGGGSPIDAAKAIGALLSHGGQLADYMGRELNRCLPPLVAMPTTAGTGSEATQFTIITDTASQVKMLLKGAILLPSLAVVDPALTMTAPPPVTAATGIDALTHAVEAFTSRKAQALSDIFALSACQRIFKYLLPAYTDGSDIEARTEMSLAALEAGSAFNNASVTLVHGMSRPIGALFHVPHGMANAMLLPACLNFAAAGAGGRFAAIARAAGLCQPGMSEAEACRQLISAIDRLCRDVRIPTMAEYGIDRNQFLSVIGKMADDALQSGSPGHTLRPVTRADIIAIYQSLWPEERGN